MSEQEGQRYELEGARVYLHMTTGPTGDSTIHIDVEHPELAGIIPVRESSYVGGKAEGLFIGLRPVQAKRAEEFLNGRI